MKPYKSIKAKVGTYTNANGEEKNRYQQLGTLFQRNDGTFCAKIEAIPVGGDWNGWVNFFDLNQSTQQTKTSSTSQVQQTHSQQESPQFAGIDEEIPF